MFVFPTLILNCKDGAFVDTFIFQLAITQTNKIYTWGVSPQVLRLQSQAAKKLKIKAAEYQAAAEKKADKLEENQPDSNEQLSYSETRNRGSEKTSGLKHVNKLSNGMKSGRSSKGINVGGLTEIQTHLTPAVVDTSCVRGQIVQVGLALFYFYTIAALRGII